MQINGTLKNCELQVAIEQAQYLQNWLFILFFIIMFNCLPLDAKDGQKFGRKIPMVQSRMFWSNGWANIQLGGEPFPANL